MTLSCRINKDATSRDTDERAVCGVPYHIQRLWLASNGLSMICGVITASTRGWVQLQAALALFVWAMLTWAACEFTMACLVRQTMIAYTRGSHLAVCLLAIFPLDP